MNHIVLIAAIGLLPTIAKLVILITQVATLNEH